MALRELKKQLEAVWQAWRAWTYQTWLATLARSMVGCILVVVVEGDRGVDKDKVGRPVAYATDQFTFMSNFNKAFHLGNLLSLTRNFFCERA